MVDSWLESARLLGSAAILAWSVLPEGPEPGAAAGLREALRCELMNDADYERMERGYYERLGDAARRLGAPAEICRDVDELRQSVLRPDLSTILPDGASWSNNALGMRDRPYTKARPAGTLRIAMAGDSIGVGLGVDDGLGFEPRLERRLSRRSRDSGGPPVEILNFAVPGRSPGQRWDHFRKEGWATSPDVVLFEATQADVGWDERRLAVLLPRGIGWDCSMYGDVLERAGLRPGATGEDCRRALGPYRWDLVAEAYRTAAADCRARGVPCIWLLLPRVGRAVPRAEHDRLVGLARAAGFSAIVDVSEEFDGIDPAALALRPDDFHPNVEGHARLADRLEEELRRVPELGAIGGRWVRDGGRAGRGLGREGGDGS